jgi:hypothetical protein
MSPKFAGFGRSIRHQVAIVRDHFLVIFLGRPSLMM